MENFIFKILKLLYIRKKNGELNKFNPLTYVLILLFAFCMGLFAFFVESIDVIIDAKDEFNKKNE
jgi:hypothetical protein